MNERIKELADQALKACDDAKERGIAQYSKRFAELIVKECAQVSDKWDDQLPIGDMIKEHFGVKE